jgi:subtilisin family serine protease
MLKPVAAKVRSGQTRAPLVAGAVVVLGLGACADSTLNPSEPLPIHQLDLQASPVTAGRYIIQVGSGAADAAELARQVTRAHGGTVHFVYTSALRGFAATLPAAAVEALRRNPGVEEIEGDQVVSADIVQSAATWGLDRVDQRALPLSTTYSYNYTGAGVTAYVFDTGIRFDHNEFEGRARRGYDAINDGRAGADCNGHGTHVAGTIGGRTYGVAKGVQLVSVRVLGCDGYGLYSWMIAGMDWVLRNRAGPAVANFSLGGSVSSTLNSALANMIAAGVQTSVSAGNNGADACTKSPASTTSAVTVAASTSADARASYSNYGNCVDIFAPGSNIKSAAYGSTTGTTTMSGTSMASPHAAGALALLLQQQPGLSGPQLRDWLVSISTRNIVSYALS